jgi:hypothetical protein
MVRVRRPGYGLILFTAVNLGLKPSRRLGPARTRVLPPGQGSAEGRAKRALARVGGSEYASGRRWDGLKPTDHLTPSEPPAILLSARPLSVRVG